ncbi:MAG: hypothetical protein OXN89_00985 [Bryobacterales bacterium]|nr:hypothetical protein [Bryobacterales bacterium]
MVTRRVRLGPMETLYDHAFACMEATVHGLAGLVPSPRLVETKQGPAYRYEQQSEAQAIVQKLARLASTLRAARLLLDHGFVQEAATLERVLDEISEDIWYIVGGLTSPTDRHKVFLSAFFEEEFDADTALASTQKRKMVPRRKIRAYIARLISDLPDSVTNPYEAAEASRTVNKTQSGYVHGASPQIIEMYDGDPPKFHMDGMTGTVVEQEHRNQFWNYVYRSIMVFALAAAQFGEAAGDEEIRKYANKFARTKPGGS